MKGSIVVAAAASVLYVSVLVSVLAPPGQAARPRAAPAAASAVPAALAAPSPAAPAPAAAPAPVPSRDAAPAPANAPPSDGGTAAPDRTAAPGPACARDWTACADNIDMARNYAGWDEVRRACRQATDDAARFGLPDWSASRPPFGTVPPGRDFPRTGRATLVDTQVRFQDGFGHDVAAETRCTYDLTLGDVTDLDIEAR